VKERVEAYLLLVIATIGMCLMAASSDLIMLYLAIETTSIPLYLLAGFIKDDEKSNESGFKYLLFGAMTSAIMLYGFSLIYGFTGKTNIYEMGQFFSSFNLLALGIAFLILVGLAFKVALFPFHFWSPDVYEGSPTPVAGFLSTASKAAGFAVIIRLLTVAFPQVGSSWSMILAVLAAFTMTVGNLIALTQKSVKRLLAYSSISHAGYAMVGVVAFSNLGSASTVFYLLAYVLTNLLAFGLVYLVAQKMNSDDYTSFNGLSRRNPALGLAFLVAFLSLAGMPPFAGFVAKFLVFSAAIQSGWTWLAVIGVINSIVGLYYYLNILKSIYLYRMENEDEDKHPIDVPKPVLIGFIVLVVGITVTGTIFGPWFSASTSAIANIF
jgi:NADH-quinone oxidoreductase subunit N